MLVLTCIHGQVQTGVSQLWDKNQLSLHSVITGLQGAGQTVTPQVSHRFAISSKAEKPGLRIRTVELHLKKSAVHTDSTALVLRAGADSAVRAERLLIVFWASSLGPHPLTQPYRSSRQVGAVWYGSGISSHQRRFLCLLPAYRSTQGICLPGSLGAVSRHEGQGDKSGSF